MDEFVTDGATRPPSTEHRFVPKEAIFTHPAKSRLNPKHHRRPVTAAFSNTHREEYSGAIGGKTRESEAQGRECAMIVFD